MSKYKHPYDQAVPTHINREGRPFHLNGTEYDGYATIRFEDTGEFLRIKWERIAHYYE